jgi:protein-S-isoprenylcysteine O-methyltransferase Ste14
MQRKLVFIYGIFSYLVFLASFVYGVGFIGNFLVPKAIDSAPQVPFLQALLINLGLLGVFAVQHSLMARKPFKRWLTRYIPKAAERSTYVLASSVLLIVLFVLWQPMGGVIWNISGPVASAVMYGLYALGWLVLFYATFLVDHFDLFGLRQIWFHLRGREYVSPKFTTRQAYQWIRHPIYLGWLMIVWATPTMTIAHLVFAIGCTAYIFVGVWFEERDLIDEHPEYEVYRKQVPMVLPIAGKRRLEPVTESC